MARLVVHPGSPSSWEIQLKPGENLIGRSNTSHFQISHPSVSGIHCRIFVSNGQAQITDLGSTNGTFLNRAPIQEGQLETGCKVQLGEVELLFLADQPPGAQAAIETAPAAELAIEPGAPPSTLQAANLRPLQHCKFHPAMAARYECSKCRHYFCETCVATRTGGAHQKFCRHCGSACQLVTVQYEAVVSKTFSQRLPGAFVYPLRGTGVIIVIVGIVLVGMVKWGQALFRYGSVRAIIFGAILEMFAGGYLFTYLQGIVHSTAAEDRELPDLPGISNFLEDVILPFFRLLGLTLFCFTPGVICGIWFLKTHDTSSLCAFLATTAFACFYYPMAFLAVAIHDSVTAANPLLVVPSIIKVLGKYCLPLFILAAMLCVQWFGALAIAQFFPESWTTHAMFEFIAMIASIAFLSFLSLYLLVVAVHLLGLIFVTSKEELGWLGS